MTRMLFVVLFQMLAFRFLTDQQHIHATRLIIPGVSRSALPLGLVERMAVDSAFLLSSFGPTSFVRRALCAQC
jgi:hypothetical protein